MRFERPGAQASDAAAVSSTGAASLEKLSETEKVAIQIAHDSGRVARKELMEQTGVGRMKATETLKRLAKKGSRMGRIQTSTTQGSTIGQVAGGKCLPATCPRHSASLPNAARARADIPFVKTKTQEKTSGALC